MGNESGKELRDKILVDVKNSGSHEKGEPPDDSQSDSSDGPRPRPPPSPPITPLSILKSSPLANISLFSKSSPSSPKSKSRFFTSTNSRTSEGQRSTETDERESSGILSTWRNLVRTVTSSSEEKPNLDNTDTNTTSGSGDSLGATAAELPSIGDLVNRSDRHAREGQKTTRKLTKDASVFTDFSVGVRRRGDMPGSLGSVGRSEYRDIGIATMDDIMDSSGEINVDETDLFQDHDKVTPQDTSCGSSELGMTAEPTVRHDEGDVSSPDSGLCSKDISVNTKGSAALSPQPLPDLMSLKVSPSAEGTELSRDEQVSSQAVDDSFSGSANREENLTVSDDAPWAEVESVLASVDRRVQVQETQLRCDIGGPSLLLDGAIPESLRDEPPQGRTEIFSDGVNQADLRLSDRESDELHVCHVSGSSHVTCTADHVTDSVADTQISQSEETCESPDFQNAQSTTDSEATNQNTERSHMTDSTIPVELTGVDGGHTPQHKDPSSSSEVDEEEEDIEDEDDQDASLSYDIDDISDALSDDSTADAVETKEPGKQQQDSISDTRTTESDVTEDSQNEIEDSCKHSTPDTAQTATSDKICVPADTNETNDTAMTKVKPKPDSLDICDTTSKVPLTNNAGNHSSGSSPVGEEESAWRRIENLDLESVLRQFDRPLDGEEVDASFPVHCFEEFSIQAEKRLAARREARQEAREIRMREIDRQRKEDEEKDKSRSTSVSTQRSSTPSTSRFSARQDSEEAVEDTRSLKRELQAAEEKFTKAMMDNASLDNEKQMLRYEVDLFKDKLEDLEEEHTELQRLHKDKNKNLEQTKRDNKNLSDEVAYLKQQIQLRDKLIEEYGLVFISNDTLESAEGEARRKAPAEDPGNPALVTPQASEILKKQSGSLDERLTKFDEEQKSLEEEMKKLRIQLDQEKERSVLAEKYATPRVSHVNNGPDVSEIQMESQRQLNDYKFKLKKAEQDITTLEGNVIRLESQVKRYKQSAENSEKNEEDLKAEKRKLLREVRDAQNQIEELQTQNQHLVKRMEKMKSARNAILNS